MSVPSRKFLAVGTLGMMTSAAIVTSLRGLPTMAKEELTMFFYLGFSTILFLIPAGLVAAELGSAFGKREGGLYVWVGEAFGKGTGFVAIFLQWVQNIVFYPTGLSFAAAALAFTMGNGGLATNNIFVAVFTMVAFWACTAVALVSNRFAAKVTQYGFVLGTAIPGLILIAGLVWWIAAGHPLGWETTDNTAVAQATGEPRWLPQFAGLASVAFLATILLNFAGVESQAVHVTELKNPSRGYPMVIMIAALVCVSIFTLGALAVAGLLPYDGINLQTGVFDAFRTAFGQLIGVTWPVVLVSLLICYGALGGVLAWITGPSRGVLATAKDGRLPPFMQKTTKTGVQKNILLLQGVVVTLLACIYFVVTDVSVVFFLISSLAASLYIIVYVFMYLAAIRLRYKRPDLERPFKIPGGPAGIWIFAGIGLIAVAFAFVVAFFPPAQLPVGSPATYVALVAGGAIIFTAAPLILERFRKPSWMPATGEQGTVPDQARRVAPDRERESQ